MTCSVPHTLADETVWVRVDGDQVVVTHCAPSGPIEVARHQRSTPGHPMIDDAHYPARPAGPLGRRPKPTSAAEAEFLAIGDGARTWLVEAAAAGTSRVKVKMAQAVTLARLHGAERLDGALSLNPPVWWVCVGCRVREKGLLICDDCDVRSNIRLKNRRHFCVCIIAQSGPVRNDLRS